MYCKAIIVNDKIIELTDFCCWQVVDGVLRNMNTCHDEGVEGDIVRYRIGKKYYEGHVIGYTCHQLITTKEFGSVCLSAEDCPPYFIHKTEVEPIDDILLPFYLKNWRNKYDKE